MHEPCRTMVRLGVLNKNNDSQKAFNLLLNCHSKISVAILSDLTWFRLLILFIYTFLYFAGLPREKELLHQNLRQCIWGRSVSGCGENIQWKQDAHHHWVMTSFKRLLAASKMRFGVNLVNTSQPTGQCY